MDNPKQSDGNACHPGDDLCHAKVGNPLVLDINIGTFQDFFRGLFGKRGSEAAALVVLKRRRGRLGPL